MFSNRCCAWLRLRDRIARQKQLNIVPGATVVDGSSGVILLAPWVEGR